MTNAASAGTFDVVKGILAELEARRARRALRRVLGFALGVAGLASLALACSGDDASGSADTGGGGSKGGSNGRGGDGAGGETAGAPSSLGGAAGTSSTEPPADAEQFWADFAEAVCHRYWHCPQEEDQHNHRARLRAVAGDEQTCTDLLLEVMLLRTRIQAVNRAVQSGDLSIQPAEVAHCLEMAAVCEYPPDIDPPPGDVKIEDVVPCREVFDGTLATGADCDLSEQCAGAAMCVRGGSTECAGTCQPLLEEGEACVVDRECAAPEGYWPLCSNAQCAVREIGTPAASAETCGVSSGYPLCESDLWCPLDYCVPPRDLGDSCDPEAVELSQCVDGYCAIATNLCTPFVVRTTAGEDCTDPGFVSLATELCDPFSSLVCFEGSCVSTDRSAGSPCNPDYWFDAVLCPPEPLLPEGSDCTSGDQCESGLCRETCAAILCASG